jgi:hypothetical protein
MWVCTFKIYEYGISGNELPPPISRTHLTSVLSSEESEKSFRDRMQAEGMAIRSFLEHRFKAKPAPYSCAPGCDWSITKVGSVSDIVAGLQS